MSWWPVLVACGMSLLLPAAALADRSESDALGAQQSRLATGVAHTCAILDDDELRCWGFNAYAQLGHGDALHFGDEVGETAASDAAVAPVAMARHAVVVSTGATHTCVILDDGQVRCVGGNQFGQLGRGHPFNYGSQPSETLAADGSIVGLPADAQIASSGLFHMCVVLEGGALRCWGENASGQLGQGDVAAFGDEDGELADAAGAAVPLPAGRSAVGVSAGDGHTCVMTDAPELRCAGASGAGQLGLGRDQPFGDEAGELLAAVGAVVPLPPGVAPLWEAADLRLEPVAPVLSSAPGEVVTPTWRLTNDGPSASGNVKVAVSAGDFELLGAPSPVGGTWAGTTWSLAGSLESGESRDIAIAVRAGTAGVRKAVAEITAAALPDGDSTPANGLGFEDDRAEIAVDTTQPPAPPEPTPVPTLHPTVNAPPTAALTGLRARARAGRVRTLRGTSADVDGRVVAVRLAVSRPRGDDCATLSRGGRWRPSRRCRSRFVLVAEGTDPWSLRLPLPRGLRPGRYTIAVRATDDGGLHQRPATKRLLRVRRGR